MDDAMVLDNYFNGLLGPEEARAVEARVATDSVFAAAFTLRRQMEAFPRQEAERQKMLGVLQRVGAEHFQAQKNETPALTVVRSNVRRWMALAASLTLIAVAVWFFTQNNAPTYVQYARHERLSLTVMGNSDQAKTDAESAFAQKDYAKALNALDQVAAAEPTNVKAGLYRGICLLELGRTQEARAVFEPLASGRSALREEAAWYTALSYLKENNLPACKVAMEKIAPGEAHYREAQEIAKGIK